MPKEPEVVWLTEERRFAILVNLGAYYSTVCYRRNGWTYELQVSNDEFEYWDEGGNN